MKFYRFTGFIALMVSISLLSGCGTSATINPPNLFNGAVFISDHNQIGVNELFISDSETAEATKVSAPLVGGGNVSSFLVSPNVGFIAYLADQDIDTVNELYFLKNGEDAPVKINPDLAVGREVTQYQWSPNGTYMAYVADQDSDNVFELYISDARTVVKVSASGAFGNIVDFKWSPDSQYIAYTVATAVGGSAVELHVSKSDASIVGTQVSNSFTGTAPVQYEWAPLILSLSNFIAYSSDQDTAIVDLYVAAVSDFASSVDTQTNKITVTDATTGSVQAFRWPNSNTAVIAFNAPLIASGDINLFVADIAAATVTTVSAVTVGGGVTDDFEWAPTNTSIAYVANQDDINVFELYTTLPDGTETGVKRSAPIFAGGNGVDVTEGFIWNSSGTQLIYRADQETPGVSELFTSTVDGVTNTEGVKISADLTGGSVDFEFKLSPFGNQISYTADQTGAGVIELFITNLIDNINVLKASADLDATRKVFQHSWSKDGTKLVYIADQDIDTINNIYTYTVNTIATLNLSTSPTATGITQAVLIDGSGVTDNLFPL